MSILKLGCLVTTWLPYTLFDIFEQIYCPWISSFILYSVSRFKLFYLYSSLKEHECTSLLVTMNKIFWSFLVSENWYHIHTEALSEILLWSCTILYFLSTLLIYSFSFGASGLNFSDKNMHVLQIHRNILCYFLSIRFSKAAFS